MQTQMEEQYRNEIQAQEKLISLYKVSDIPSKCIREGQVASELKSWGGGGGASDKLES